MRCWRRLVVVVLMVTACRGGNSRSKDAPVAGDGDATTSGQDGTACTVDGDCVHGHCVSNVPSGTGGTCCATSCSPSDGCHVAQCSTGTCQDTMISSGQCVVAADGGQLTACGVAALGCGAPPDVDGDNLPDAWESSNNGAGVPFVDVNCNGIWDPQSEPLLPGASPTRPDIYVTYDYMGPGLDGESCATSNNCLGDGAYHAGETCNASGQCQYTCSQHSDCTSRSGPAHVGETCLLFANGGTCTDVPGSPTGACACYHTHDPEVIAPGALQKVIDVFDLHGVGLHILRGSQRPHSHVVSYRTDAEMDVSCEGASTAASAAGIGKYAVSVYDLKALAPNTSYFMHYALFAHYSGCDAPAHCPANAGSTSDCPNPSLAYGQGGLAELNGNDLVVSLGGLVNNTGLAPGITSTAGFSEVGSALMHELGHNLGLHHDGHVDTPCLTGTTCATGDTCTTLADGEGKVCHETVNGVLGNEEPNYKPNYVSLMNYQYQATGIESSSTRNVAAAGMPYTPGSNVPDPTLTRLDYSNQVLNTLVENNLDDVAGLGWTLDPLYPTAYMLFAYTDGTCHFCPQQAAAAGSVDWMCAGCAVNSQCQLIGSGPSVFSSPTLSADVDSPDGTCSSPTDTLHGHKDWGSFVYAFQCAPTFANGVTPPANFPPEADAAALSGRRRGVAASSRGTR